MELTTIANIKNLYAETLTDYPEHQDALQHLMQSDEQTPIYFPSFLEAEAPPDYNKEQRELSELSLDLNAVNNATVEIKNNIDALLNRLDAAAADVESALANEEERIRDINMLCGIDSEYNLSIPIKAENFTQASAFENIEGEIFGAQLVQENKIAYSITSVSGNGYSGNNYVYIKDVGFAIDQDDYSKCEYIKDENDVTAFEYSRLVTNNKSEAVDTVINYDTKEVQCVITLAAEEEACRAKILSDTKDVQIANVEISDDGITFKSCLKNPVSINTAEKQYDDNTYIYGSNIICFPYTKYIRLTFTSDLITDDAIALPDGDNVILKPNTRRKKIRLNEIILYSANYKTATLTTDNLIAGGSADKIGLFLNQYIPDHFEQVDYLTYWLIVNGKEYEVKPVNSAEDGIKIIKFAEKEKVSAQEYVENITETIKSAGLKIQINPYNGNETPYIANVKLLLGKE